jgi:hypothetical protein
MKVIEPLFLNELYEEFEKHKGKPKKLRQLIYRISKLKIFDPACGSGNFLIIAYKELRKLEIEIIKEINGIGQTEVFHGSQSKIHFTKDGYQVISNAPQSKINFGGTQIEIWFTEIKLSQFYGIELDDFAHEMAILSLWLAEHQMNKEFVNELQDFGKAKPILPLKEAGHITQGNATRLTWEDTCPKNKNDEIYILGNPPYLGYSRQDKDQKEDMKIVFSSIKNFKKLDYIACWFVKGSHFIKNTKHQYAFVSTNSVTQGEQVALLWPNILNKRLEVGFAHTSFRWTNNAKGNAGVSVIIIGIRSVVKNQKIIFTDSISKKVNNINPYLLDTSNLIVHSSFNTLSKLPTMIKGSSPGDNGNLLLEEDEKNIILKENPSTIEFFKKYIGAREFMNGNLRYCILINENNYAEAVKIQLIKNRFDKVSAFRLKSKKASTREKAKYPYLFDENKYQNSDSILIPQTGSERREYLPIGFFDHSYVISNAARVIYNAEPWLFGLLSSKAHMVWTKAVAGRLKTDMQYSNTLCYNTFPFPEISQKQKEQINLHV